MKTYSIKIVSTQDDGDILSIIYKAQKETLVEAITGAKKVAGDVFQNTKPRQIEVIEYDKQYENKVAAAMEKMADKI